MAWNFVEKQPAGNVDNSWWLGDISADGTKIVVSSDTYNTGGIGRIYYSSNSGATFTEIQPVGDLDVNWGYSLKISANGLMIAACTRYNLLRYSMDAGDTWSGLDPEGLSNQVDFCSMSSDGAKIIAIQSSKLWLTTNYGSTWTELENFTYNIPGGADLINISDDGTKIYLHNGLRFWYSSDSGVSWTEPRPFGDVDTSCYSTRMSGDGTVFLANTVINGVQHLMYSTNSGTSWVEIKPNGTDNNNWTSGRLSNNGTMIFVVGANDVSTLGRCFYSTNSGSSWTEVQPAGDIDTGWWLGLMSDDASIFVAGQYDSGTPGEGRLYLGTFEEDPPTTTEAPTTTPPPTVYVNYSEPSKTYKFLEGNLFLEIETGKIVIVINGAIV